MSVMVIFTKSFPGRAARYQAFLALAYEAVEQSPFGELPLTLGVGTITVKDLFRDIWGRIQNDYPYDPVAPTILSAMGVFRAQATFRREVNNILRPEFIVAQLEPILTPFFEADAMPVLRWLRNLLKIPIIFLWFRALLWAALPTISTFTRTWLKKLVAVLPQWLQMPALTPRPFTSFFEAFDDYIFNELPTHLIRLQDMKLVGRDDIREALRSRISVMTEVDLLLQTLGYNIFNPHHQVSSQFNLAIQHYLKFAIFSHRWGPEEPSFRAMMETSPQDLCNLPQGPGFEKLLKFCKEARRHGCMYAWSDTCCINKESSSELQEAIRSMYRWYHNAEICITYLGESVSPEDFEFEPWFTRGWTLQELLAPRRIKFYGKYWTPIKPYNPCFLNDKFDDELMAAIEKVTMIPRDDLRGFTPSCSRVHEKMIWASKRRTTRVEDKAYCLLGIFDITIPISYGEGPVAFHRLMEAILQRCGESGILAWLGDASPYSLAIPASPACYMQGFRDVDKKPKLTDSVSFTFTRDGLDVELLVVDVKMTSDHRGNKAWTSPTLNLANARFSEVILRPKWTLPKKSVQVSADERDLQRCSTWAMGIVCSRDADGHATLEAGKKYAWLLIGKVPNGRSSGWIRARTKHISTFLIERNVRSRLKTIHFPHKL